MRGGVESRIVRLSDAQGQVRHTAWVRTSVETGVPVFVGQYGTATIPGHAGPCIKVVFPLPNGNAIILLRPRADPDGGCRSSVTAVVLVTLGSISPWSQAKERSALAMSER